MGHELSSIASHVESPRATRTPSSVEEQPLERLADRFVSAVAGITSRRKLWHHIRSVRFGSGVTAYAEFNLRMQALGRETTLRQMVTRENAERIARFVTAPRDA